MKGDSCIGLGGAGIPGPRIRLVLESLGKSFDDSANTHVRLERGLPENLRGPALGQPATQVSAVVQEVMQDGVHVR